MPPQIYDYVDHRRWIRDHLRGSQRTHASLAEALGRSVTWLSRVLHGTLAPTSELTANIAQELGLDADQAAYLGSLVDLQTSEGRRRVSAWAEVQARHSSFSRRAAPISSWLGTRPWYVSALLQLSLCEQWRDDPSWAASMLDVDEKDVRAADAALRRMGLLGRHPETSAAVALAVQPLGVLAHRASLRGHRNALAGRWSADRRLSLCMWNTLSDDTIARWRVEIEATVEWIVGLAATDQGPRRWVVCTSVQCLPASARLVAWPPPAESREEGLPPPPHTSRFGNPLQLSYVDLVRGRMRDLGLQQKQLAALLPRSEAWVSRFLAHRTDPSDLPDETVDALNAALQLDSEGASELAALMGVTDWSPRERRKAWHYLDGLSKLRAVEGNLQVSEVSGDLWNWAVFHELRGLPEFEPDPSWVGARIVPSPTLEQAEALLERAMPSDRTLIMEREVPDDADGVTLMQQYVQLADMLGGMLQGEPGPDTRLYTRWTALSDAAYQQARTAVEELQIRLVHLSERGDGPVTRVYFTQLGLFGRPAFSE